MKDDYNEKMTITNRNKIIKFHLVSFEQYYPQALGVDRKVTNKSVV